MLVFIFSRLHRMWANVAANQESIVTIVVAIVVFMFFLGCMARAVGMKVLFDATIAVTAVTGTIRMLFRGIGWLVRGTFRCIRGAYNGSYNLFRSMGMNEFGRRICAMGVTGILILVII